MKDNLEIISFWFRLLSVFCTSEDSFNFTLLFGCLFLVFYDVVVVTKKKINMFTTTTFITFHSKSNLWLPPIPLILILNILAKTVSHTINHTLLFCLVVVLSLLFLLHFCTVAFIEVLEFLWCCFVDYFPKIRLLLNALKF